MSQTLERAFKEYLFIRKPFNLMAASLLISINFYLISHTLPNMNNIIFFAF